MCGRYLFYDGDSQKLKSLIEVARKQLDPKQFDQLSLYEVFPTQLAFVGIYNENKKAFLIKTMYWGYKYNDKNIINARSESISDKPLFKDNKRCVILASGYYEWDKATKKKYYFATASKPLYLAGLYRKVNNQESFVILTKPAQAPQSSIHDRQPIVMDVDQARAYCLNEDMHTVLENNNPKISMVEAEVVKTLS